MYLLYSLFVSDTNECATIDNAGCDQTCVNEIGSYHCECEVGYTLNSDDHLCDGKHMQQMCFGMRYFLCNSVHFVIDIDECTENSHNCSHECINTIGSYVCDCNIGYQLDDTLLQCVGMHF